ncbi:MAG: hypothetical protein BWX80_02656 [Candidatus Hydrogenedentes bacterium ADurb.Bin101]|nr:MAG: hypothetical protein BWX80_02656 [Candidatus Hydrogenedentes bacterium ADurb.Bin101]
MLMQITLLRSIKFRVRALLSGRFDKHGEFYKRHTFTCPPSSRWNGVVETNPLYGLYLREGTHQDDYVTLVEEFNAEDRPGRRPQEFLNLFLEIVEAP